MKKIAFTYDSREIKTGIVGEACASLELSDTRAKAVLEDDPMADYIMESVHQALYYIEILRGRKYLREIKHIELIGERWD